MKIVGLTGGIGSGKSTVLNFFKEFGADFFIADDEAKILLTSNDALIDQIKQQFGSQAYINNKLNRKFISSIVFSDKEKLESLNNLVHPAVKKRFDTFVENSKSNLIIYESAILFESGSDEFCDIVITVVSNLEDRINRILKEGYLTRDEILNRVENQTSDDFKVMKSDFVIENNQLANTKKQIENIYKTITKT